MGFSQNKAPRLKRKGKGRGAFPGGSKKPRQKGPKGPREPDGEPMIEEKDEEVAMAEGQPEAQVAPLAHPKPTAEAGPETVDAAANLATLAAVNEVHANPGSYEEYQEDVRKTKAARLSHGEAARSRTATKSPRDKGAAKSRSPASSSKKNRAGKKRDKTNSSDDGDAAADEAEGEAAAEAVAPPEAEGEVDGGKENSPKQPAPPSKVSSRTVSCPAPPQRTQASARATSMRTQHCAHTCTMHICNTTMESAGFCRTILGGGPPTPNGSTVGAPPKVRCYQLRVHVPGRARSSDA